MFWMRLSRISADGNYQRGTIFECQDGIQARIDGTKIMMTITTRLQRSDGSLSSTLDRTELEVEISNDIEQLLQWNSYAFSFQNSIMRIYFNGQVAAEKEMLSQILNRGTQCTVGNSIDLRNSFHGHLRHLILSQEGLNSYQSLQSKIRQVPSPNDLRIVSYFKFDKDWQQQDSFFYISRDYTVKSVTVEYSSEPEKVCYCTTSPVQVLRMNRDLHLRPIFFNQTMTASNGVLDQNGLAIQFLIMPIRLEQPETDQLLFSFSRYFDLRLVNRSQSLRIDMFNGSQTNPMSVNFRNYRFRLQSWSQYRIQILPSQAVLSLDGVQVDSVFHNVTNFNINSQSIVINQQANLVYLLHSMTIQDANSRTVFDMTFAQNVLDQSFIQSGRFLFESNNQLCSTSERQNPGAFISSSGDTCRDSRLFPLFGSRFRGNQTALTGMIRSSGQPLTIEFWMKDMKIPTPAEMNSVILENQFGGEIKTQIVLASNPANLNQKSIKVFPYLSMNSSQQIDWRTQLSIKDNWLHVAIIGNPNSIRIVVFNHTRNSQDILQQQGISLFPFSNDLNTSIGSSLNGFNKFVGILRELRIWATARRDFDIANTRYSSQPQRNSLLHYFRLNSANEIYVVDDLVTNKGFTERSPTSNSIVWTVDRDLLICKPDHFYNGQCCQQISLDGLDIQINYNPSKSLIMTSIVNTSAVNPNLLNSIVANFSVTNFGYTNNQPTVNQIRRLFTVNRTQGFNVSSIQIDPIVFNITLQGRIFSIFGNSYVVVTKTFTLQCPNFYIEINNQTQIFQSEQPYIVSSSADSFLQLQMLPVQNQSQLQCFNPRTQTIQNVSINQIQWNHQLSVPNNALSFQQVWNLSSDNRLATFRRLSMQSQRWNRVFAKIYYNTVNIIEVSVNLTYSTVQPNNPQFSGSSFTRNYLQNEQIDINFANTTSSDNLQYPNVSYGVICPQSLFTPADYSLFCVMRGSRFTVSIDILRRIIYGQIYQFQFLIGIEGTSIIRTITGNIVFYQDGQFKSRCPIIEYSSQYQIDKSNNNSVLIQPNAFLACGRTFWEPTTIDSTITDIRTQRAITGIFSQPNQQVNLLEQVVFKDNINVRNLIGGSQFRVATRVQFRQVNQTGIRIPVNTTSTDATYQLNVRKNPIQQVLQYTNQNRALIDPLRIAFTESNFTINASLSFDPDNPSMRLNYTWICPSVINDLSCRIMQTGLRNNSIIFPMLLKMQLGLQQGVIYNFQLIMFNIDNSLAQPLTVTIPVQFAYPRVNESVPNEMRSSICDQLEITSSQFIQQQSDSLGQTIQYNINNWDQALINPQIRSSCSNPAVEDLYLFFYLFDGSQATSDSLRSLIQQRSPVPSFLETQMQTSDFSSLKTISAKAPVQGSFFLFVQRQGTTRLSLIIEKIYFERKFADLVAQVAPTQLTIDQFQSFSLNASTSFDLENATNKNFTYVWECPQFNEQGPPAACLTRGPILNITFNDRVRLGANEIDQGYEYKVRIVQGERESQQVISTVTLIKRQDYSDCIKLNERLNHNLLSYDIDLQDKTFTYTRDSPSYLVYEVIPTMTCETVRIVSQQFETRGSKQFWSVDQNNQNKIIIQTNDVASLNLNQVYPVVFKVKIQLGDSSVSFFEKASQISIKVIQNLQPKIDEKQIFRYSIDQGVFINASLTNSGKFSCIWDCPFDLGGNSCLNGCFFNKTFFELNAMARRARNISIADMFNQTLTFNVTLRQNNVEMTVPKSIYLIDGSGINQDPFSQFGIENCSIKIFGQNDVNSLSKLVQQQTVFFLGCGFDNLTSYIMTPQYFNLQWKVEGLTPFIDYVNKSGQLFVKPYALTKLQSSTIIVSLNISTANGVSLGNRILQEFDNTYSEDLQAFNPDDTQQPQPPIENNPVVEEEDTINKPGQIFEPSIIVSPPITEDVKPEFDLNKDDNSQPPADENKILPEEEQQSDQNVSSNQTSPANQTDNTTLSLNNQTLNQTQVINETLNSNSNQSVVNETQLQFTPPVYEPDFNISQTLSQRNIDTSIKQVLSFKKIGFKMGAIRVTTRMQTSEFYTTNFTFNFSDYLIEPPQVIMFQLRAVQDELYNSSQILIPLKIFSRQSVEQFYSQIFIPKANEIYVDFFDGDLNYLGSQELRQISNPLEQVRKIGSMTYNQVDRLLQTLQSRVSIGYMQINEQTQIQFDQDMRRVLEISEFINLGGLTGLESFIDSLFQRIISFLRVNFDIMQSTFDQNNFFDKRQILINQKRVILVFYNLLKVSSSSQRLILPALNLFEKATNDFETLCYNSGEDSTMLIQAVLFIQNIFKGQLQSINMANKKQFFDIIYQVTEKVYESEIKQNNNTHTKIQHAGNTRMSRTVFRIDRQSTAPIMIVNVNNPKEFVAFSQPEGSLMNISNVASLTVQYDTQDPNQISTGGTQTLTTVKALDQSGKIIDVKFKEDGDFYFDLGLTLKQQFNSSLFSRGPNNETVELGCVYFDTNKNNWDRQGVQVLSYNPDTMELRCRSYHLTQFSARLFVVKPIAPIVNQTNQNNTVTTNITVEEPIIPNPIIIGENFTVQYAKDLQYYIEKPIDYIIAVAVVGALSILLPLLYLICGRYKKKQDKGIFEDSINNEPYASSFLLRLWSVMKLYHPLISSLFNQVNPVLAIPRAYQLLMLEINLMSIVLTSVVHLVYVAPSQKQYLDNELSQVIYSLIIVGSFLVIRNLLNRLKYGMYLQYAVINEVNIDQYQTASERKQQYLQAENVSPLADHPSGIRSMIINNHTTLRNVIDDKDADDRFDHFEGGESDDEDGYVESEEGQGPRSTSQIEDSPNANHKVILGSDNEYSSHSMQHTQNNNQQEEEQKEDNLQFNIPENSMPEKFKINIKELPNHNIIVNPGQQFHNMSLDDGLEEEIDQSSSEQQSAEPHNIQLEFGNNEITPQDFYQKYSPQSDNEAPKLQDQTPSFGASTVLVNRVQNNHDLKGTRIFLFILLSLILMGELAAIFVIMRQVQNKDAIIGWIKLCVSLSIIWILGVDTVACFIFTLIFQCTKSIKSTVLKITGALLVGNFDSRSYISLNLEFKGII